MITEPEASWETGDDGDSGDHHGGGHSGGESGWRTEGPGGAGGRLPGPRSEVMEGLPPGSRPLPKLPGWVWGALAGVVAASLVWAALAYAGVAPRRHTEPDLHGYRIGDSPCAGHSFDAFDGAVQAASGIPSAATFEHNSAVDRAACIYTTEGGPSRGSSTTYQVQVAVALHHRTDPTTEFEAERSVDPLTMGFATGITTVPHLGDEAYALAFASRTRILEVRSGGAVITLRLDATTRPYGTGPNTEALDLPDLGRITPALAEVARAIMADMAS